MIENNNKSVINKLARKSYNANKGRNSFILVAIILTTLLFTSLFTIGISMNKSSEYSTMRKVGTTFHGSFKNLTTEEYKKIRDNKSIKEQGLTTVISTAENKELAKRSIEIRYADENYIKNAFATPIKGRTPKKQNEILVDTITLDMLEIPHEINQNINIKYKLNGRDYNEDFLVTGIYEGDTVSNASSLYTSKQYSQKVFASINQSENKENEEGLGRIDLSVNFSNSLFLENKFIKVIEESGHSDKDIDYGVNWAYMGGNSGIDKGTLFYFAGFILFIMLTGYLIICNVFYISIVKDIKFYGLLKTIGTTKKQIRKIIIKQALTLSKLGISVGIILGYSIGIVILPIVMSNLTIEYTKVSANPVIFIGAILFSLGTVLISTNRPAKMASRISPIEAAVYSGVSGYNKRKLKKGSNGANLVKMALSNILKTKKKTLLVVMSLSLSIILLNTVYTLVSGFDIDKYLRDLIGTDFTIGDASFYRWNFDSNAPNSLNYELCEELEKIDGVGKVYRIYHRELQMPLTKDMKERISKFKDDGNSNTKACLDNIKDNNTIRSMYYGVDRGIYDLLKNYIVEGTFDVEKFETGNYIIAEKELYEGSISKSKVGGKITIPFEDGNSKEYEILAIVGETPLYLRIGYFYGELGGFVGYLPTEEYKKTTSNRSIMTGMFNVDGKNNISKVDNAIKSFIVTNPSLDYRSRSSYASEFKGMVNSYEIVGYGLSLIVGVIGVLNFINVMITSIITRKKELSMLKSIGMTKRQVKRMIKLEGLYYGIFTTVVVVIIGFPVNYLGVNILANSMSMFNYRFTVLPLVFMLIVLYMVVLITPNICLKKFGKDSIVEVLRAIE